ncbi:MAG: hypothetical protein HY017_20205 [Betaproteobacteria bacterium]|nr:hypothetical protein [Betaproteobacteria bacterium]
MLKPLASRLPSRMAGLMAWVICAIMPIAPGPAAAVDAPIVRFLNASPETDGAMAYVVGTGADLLLPFTGPQGSALEFYLSPFRGEHGDAIAARPSIAELPGASVKDQRLSFAVDRPILTLHLKVPALPTASKYSGTLVVLQQGKVQQANRLVLSRALAQRPARVTVDARSITVHDQIGSGDPATFKLLARNASAEWSADGIFLRLLDITAPAGANFDPARNLKLTWNGQMGADDLWRSPPAESTGRSIAPNQQAEIGGELVDLAPGEYTVKLGLGAANAMVDSEQPITLKLYVKHAVWLPLALLLLAIVISYVATKGLETQRRRVSQLKQVASLRPGWLREEPVPLPTIAASAILRQVEDRNRKWSDALFGQDVTSARIAEAELLIRILDRVRGIRSRIKSSAWNALVRNRANKRLDAITGSLNPGSVEENSARQIEAELAKLEQWFDARQLDELYWLTLKSDMEGLKARVRPETFNEHADLVKELHDEISAALLKAPTGDPLYQVEETYAELKILCERNENADGEALKRLGDLLKTNRQMGIEKFFHAADGIAWSRLQTADFRFIAPARNEVEPPQAYQLIQFEIEPADRRLGNNYLFKHKIEYIWSLDFNQDGGQRKPLTQRRTNVPRIVQYVPRPGELYVSVTLRYNDEQSQKSIELGPLRIQSSSEYGLLSAFRFNEITSLGISTVFAVVSGLATFYFGKPAFGSVGDYITLFIWGAGVDQTKNFIQHLERVSGPG